MKNRLKSLNPSKETHYRACCKQYVELTTIDPSAALKTPVRAGPNGADRVLGDKERRVMEIF